MSWLIQLAPFSLLGCLSSGIGGTLLVFRGFSRLDHGTRPSDSDTCWDACTVTTSEEDKAWFLLFSPLSPFLSHNMMGNAGG